MSFGEAVRTVYRNYARFDGRATRPEYWWYTLFYFLVVIGAWFIVLVFVGTGSFTYDNAYPYYHYAPSPLFSLSLLAIGIFGLVNLLPGLAVAVRRLHDSDKSGWWILIAFIPYVGVIVLIVLLALPSTVGFNRFGPPVGGQPASGPRAQYLGTTRSEALQKFAADAQDAARSGFEPAWQEWRSYPGGEMLEVIYSQKQADPPWRASQGSSPMNATGTQHPFDGPPPEGPTGA
jgi:uncharacterized membrane protein YhaH (DUF805 family)